MIPASFDYLAPTSLDMVVEALVSLGEDARIIAGGHSLIPMMKLRLARPSVLIDLSKIPELGGMREESDRIAIGALTTHYQVESSELLGEKCPLLSQTASVIGDTQVRNRGTIGGSLAHADPAADLPAAFLALGGELQVTGSEGERKIKAEDFFLDIMTTALKPTEIITAITFPTSPDGMGTSYQKMAQKASGFAIAGVAACISLTKEGVCSEAGVGVTGLGSKPFRARRVEEILRGKRLSPSLIEKASSQVTEGVDPLDDHHASAEFRTHLARLYTARAIGEAVERTGA
ncbi:MAG: xanthine dehydrogenase family protein subunit M [Nitrospinota bacterium]|jgi:carbon-monoxide dehydrogenase medium subunit|nr:xanthine dehydrogenase family protein subunit M [Nitrospinota bacterium]